jgi:Fe2+ transport system protein FeoA
MRLDELETGESAVVTGIGNDGPERRRMMDLGILPGTVITAEMRSPLGDPTAYRVRGALLALRRDQARHIQIAHIAAEKTPGEGEDQE